MSHHTFETLNISPTHNSTMIANDQTATPKNGKKNFHNLLVLRYTVVFGYKDIVYMDKTTEIWPFL